MPGTADSMDSNSSGNTHPGPDQRTTGSSPADHDRPVVDRRTIPDRRKLAGRLPGGDSVSGLERRRGPGRRLSDFQRSAEEGELTTEQFLFLVAIDEFKKANNKTFPTWTDVLEVIRLLGYRKTQPSELHLQRAEDWSEQPDAPAQVRPARWQERFRDPPRREAA
ncbi:MAG: hypothetical protein AMXMBFR58_23970 [Phycisphaerae bacterium]|nr:hypothetical protein [Phycisphaerales bacterium]MCK6478208.1 hypothetical protein [Phycisphaerales bacterium]